jgi:hypothetical protein
VPRWKAKKSWAPVETRIAIVSVVQLDWFFLSIYIRSTLVLLRNYYNNYFCTIYHICSLLFVLSTNNFIAIEILFKRPE